MIHVILGVLKITGIIFLIIILLLAVVFISVLLVPVRYRIRAVRTDDETGGELYLTWLLHLFSVRAAYSLAEKTPAVKIKIFGINPKTVAGFFKNIARHMHGNKKSSAKSGRQTIEKTAKNPDKKTEKKPEKRQADSSKKKAEGHSESSDSFYKAKKYFDKIKQIPGSLRNAIRKIKNIAKKPGQLWQKIKGFFQMAEKYEAADTLREAWTEIKNLLYHCRVRKGSGYFRFGTGDAERTGEITGVLYLLIPVSLRDISIEPSFTESVFETEISIKGHIRIIRIVQCALRLFSNRNLRRLLQEMRK